METVPNASRCRHPPTDDGLDSLERVFRAAASCEQSCCSLAEALHMVAVLEGSKPAALVTFYASDFSTATNSPVFEFIDASDLPSRRSVHTNPFATSPDRACSARAIIARSEDALETYLDEKEYQAPARALGSLLGYPEESIEAYAESASTGGSWGGTADTVEALVERGDLSPKEAGFIGLVPYVPEPSPDAVQKAIERGQMYYGSCVEFATANDATYVEVAADAVRSAEAHRFAGDALN